MKLSHPFRFAVTALFGVLLSTGLARQSASIALTRESPQLSAELFPSNGLAQERTGKAVFSSALPIVSDASSAARQAENWARAAYRLEPLTPDAHAILALSKQTTEERKEIIDLGSQLNRRNPMLQGLVLQKSVEATDYADTVRILDEILRVRPSRSADLFPVLLTVFSLDGTVAEFAKILDGTSSWHGKFVNFAVHDPKALENLYLLRSKVSFEDRRFDSNLIRNMAREGDLHSSWTLYRRLSPTKGRVAEAGRLSWVDTFPPFDWSFAEETGLRAQPGLDSDELEIYIRSGQGGVVARRFVPTPKAPFTVFVQQSQFSGMTTDGLEIRLACVESKDVVAVADLGAGKTQLTVAQLTGGCEFLEISLRGRAWTGRPTLQGKISPIEISS